MCVGFRALSDAEFEALTDADFSAMPDSCTVSLPHLLDAASVYTPGLSLGNVTPIGMASAEVVAMGAVVGSVEP